MQVLTPMTLYDASGRGMTVYAPQTLSATPPAGAPPLPSNIGIQPAVNPSLGPTPWQQGPGPVGMAGPLHLAPMPQSAPPVQPMPLTPVQSPSQLSGPLHLTPLSSMAPTGPMVTNSAPMAPAPPMGTYYSSMPMAPSMSMAPPSFQPSGFNNTPYPMTPMPPPPMAPLPPLAPLVAPLPVAAPITSTTPVYPAVQTQNSGTNIYVSNLPDSITRDSLEDIFTPHGTVLSCRVAKKQGQCPIGFVQYTQPAMAQAAVAAVNGMMVEDGRFIRVKMADHDKDKGVSSGPSSDLYICNLPPNWSYADLHATFSRYGRILSLTMFKDSGTGAHTGSGMVRFSNTAEATAAIQGLNQLYTPGMDRPLEVKYAESRTDKDKRVSTRMRFNDDKDPRALKDFPDQPPMQPNNGPERGENQSSVFGPPPTPSQGVGRQSEQMQGMSLAVQAFSRRMNSCPTDSARQTLVRASNGLQPGCGHTYTTYKSQDSSDGLSSEFPSSEEYSDPKSHGNDFKFGDGFWGNLQGMVADNDDFRMPPTAGVRQWGVVKGPDVLGSSLNEDSDTAEGSSQDGKAVNNVNYRAWRNKRKQRRAI